MSADAGSVEEFAAGVPRIVEVDGVEVAVVRWGDRFYAFRNLCPHNRGPIGRWGKIRSRLISPDRLRLDVDAETPVVICPWHRWEFQLQSGRPVFDPAGPRLSTFAVEVEHGRVRVRPKARLGGAPAPDG